MAAKLGQSPKALTVEWGTPQDLFEALDAEVGGFTLDPCANRDNHKCDHYYTKEDDGLTQDWAGETVFVNPPYGRQIADWVKKCHDEWKKHNIDIVMLIPARTDTKYFHDYIYHKADLKFLKGRIAFETNVPGVNQLRAPFPSMLVYFRKREE